MPAPLTATAYFAALPEGRHQPLDTIRELLRHIWPDIVEDMLFGMPTYHLAGKPLCALANQKNFMALYIMPYDLLDAFKNDLKVHDHGKACIRFKRLDPATLLLFDRVIRYTGARYEESTVTDRKDIFRPGLRKASTAPATKLVR